MRILVFPDTYDHPTRMPELLVGVLIASPVRLYFVPPEGRVPRRPSCMFWTTMPKAPVDEDDELRGRKHDVRPPASIDEDRTINTKSQATRVGAG
jgi:hypothetical protein